MIKKTVQTYDYDLNEVEETLLFHFSLNGMKNYERITDNRNFFADYEEASKRFSTIAGIAQKSSSATNEDELTQMATNNLNTLNDAYLKEFLLNFVRAFYTERKDGKFIQDEFTVEKAENALWLTECLDLMFFMDIFNELSKGLNARKKSVA